MPTTAPKKVGYAAGLKSSVPSAGRLANGSLATPAKTLGQVKSISTKPTYTNDVPFLKMTESYVTAPNFTSINGQAVKVPFPTLNNPPTRTPGGASILTSPQTSQSSAVSLPGRVGSDIDQNANINTPALSNQLNQGGITMGLESALSTLGSVGAKIGTVTSALGLSTKKTPAVKTKVLSDGTVVLSRYRRINPANGKAVRHALTRIKAFNRMAHSIDKAMNKAHRRK